MLLLGLGIGIAAVLLAQMLKERGVGLQSVTKVFSSSDKKTDDKKKDADAKPVKPKFDFYTILPETETVLPEKTPAKPKAKPEPKPESRPEAAKSAPEPGVSYMLQAASFATFPEADQLKARLALSGLGAQIQKVSIEGRGDYYRVRLGPFSKIEELDSASQQLQQIGLKPIRLKVKKEGA
ncbi:MAG: SPOR domain-containing protein [Gammaproteobacteria bacterium]|nr:SPOR domain-containing protein [Gammaproteobacteria bacterium]